MLSAPRRGSSLAELMVALTLAGLVLAAAGTSMLRQQRGFRWIGAVTGVESQMRPLAQTLAGDLALLDAAAGDIVAGQASDTTLQIRSTVASSLACDSATSGVTLVPDDIQGVAISGSARSPTPGDTLWFLTDTLGWQARRVVGVARVSAACRAPPTTMGATIRLALDAPLDAPGATPVRVTRQERYQLYRASDGGWYLGLSDWSVATGRFASPQPIAGPFLRSSVGTRTGFRYFDANGAKLTPDGSNERSIAHVRVTSVASVGSIASGTGNGAGGGGGSRSGASDAVRIDSADAALVRVGAP